MRPDPKAPRRSGPCPRTGPMHKLRGHGPLLQRQHGFGLVAAMFLIIVIAGVIAAMWRMSATQTATNNLTLQQTRAYQAARAGLEWGISRFLNDETCTEPPFSVPGLDGFVVTVECPVGERVERNDLHEEDLQGIVIQRIVATAEYSSVGSPDYAYRKLSTVVELGREIP
ncbi:pilus assembly protein MshP [Pseudomonas stutzeri]|nr:pilus assembly protein MshP [Stutzerimonas stutzeri]